MRKMVYLFELDSVRKTDNEIKAGQERLFNEIVVNGNVVVLTFNQLVDSRGFFSLLDSKEYSENILRLFEKGFIKISQYADIRTISQYLITSFDYDADFIFSGWPLKSTQKKLLALIRRSLMYSDLSEINYYIYKSRSDELTDLFIEVDKDKETHDTNYSVEKCRSILNNLFHLLKAVLCLSTMYNIYIPPRKIEEYNNLRLHNIIDYLSRTIPDENKVMWHKALTIITNLECYDGDKRSNYIKEIKNKCACDVGNIEICGRYFCSETNS